MKVYFILVYIFISFLLYSYDETIFFNESLDSVKMSVNNKECYLYEYKVNENGILIEIKTILKEKMFSLGYDRIECFSLKKDTLKVNYFKNEVKNSEREYLFDNKKRIIQLSINDMYNYEDSNNEKSNKFSISYIYDDKDNIVGLNGKISRKYFYMGEKIDHVEYYFRNSNVTYGDNYDTKIEKYLYDGNNYWSSPSYEKEFNNPNSPHYDKKRHQIEYGNNIKVIKDEYYIGNVIYEYNITSKLKGRVIEYIEYNKSTNTEIKYSFLYKNTTKNRFYYIPTIPNLRFRETSGAEGKFIRMIVKGEKLELLERGKQEIINGVTGNWVKVRTGKGEEGWAFDAYLEEVKE